MPVNHPRKEIVKLTEIPNIGKVTAGKFSLLHIDKPHDLIGKDPYRLYSELCHITGEKIDPCLLDVFISAVDFMEGGAPKKWWEFTAERKQKLSS
ncbi:MAG: helix-hairpin-helix domain-containing protein [Campylobacterota bacterium]|nr:helix-hairpin-helix domain-containing protein [Campylobacterota bacterium]